MSLSALQKYILQKGLETKKKTISKRVLLGFYQGKSNAPKPLDQIGIITKSVERLIDRGLAKGRGLKTKEKWFIQEVILAPTGVRVARELWGKQERLPFFKKIK